MTASSLLMVSVRIKCCTMSELNKYKLEVIFLKPNLNCMLQLATYSEKCKARTHNS